jgi:hypothetical protein
MISASTAVSASAAQALCASRTRPIPASASGPVPASGRQARETRAPASPARIQARRRPHAEAAVAVDQRAPERLQHPGQAHRRHGRADGLRRPPPPRPDGWAPPSARSLPPAPDSRRARGPSAAATPGGRRAGWSDGRFPSPSWGTMGQPPPLSPGSRHIVSGAGLPAMPDCIPGRVPVSRPDRSQDGPAEGLRLEGPMHVWPEAARARRPAVRIRQAYPGTKAASLCRYRKD